MKNIQTVLAVIVLLVCGVFSTSAQAGKWQLKKNQDGVKVYTRTVAGSSYREFKGVITVRASMDSLLAVMSDVKSACNWLHQCARSVLLDKVSFQERYTYQVTDFPWPATDRDIILHSVANSKNTNNLTIITLNSIPDYCDRNTNTTCRGKGRSTTRKRYVRVVKSKGFYRFQKNKNNTITITWQMHYEPGGGLPSWAANAALVDTPLKSLLRLKKIVRQKKYRNAKLKYNENGETVDFIEKKW